MRRVWARKNHSMGPGTWSPLTAQQWGVATIPLSQGPDLRCRGQGAPAQDKMQQVVLSHPVAFAALARHKIQLAHHPACNKTQNSEGLPQFAKLACWQHIRVAPTKVTRQWHVTLAWPRHPPHCQWNQCTSRPAAAQHTTARMPAAAIATTHQ